LKVALLWLLGYIPSHEIRLMIFDLAGVEIGEGSTIHIGARFTSPKMCLLVKEQSSATTPPWMVGRN